MTRRTRLLVLVFLLAVGASGVRFTPEFSNAAVLRPFDYMQYQSAGRAVLNGQNPYDGRVLFPLQKEIGTNWDDPVMMWNPPWTLPIALPLGAMHWRVGQLLWFAANLAAVAGSAILLWCSFGGPRDRRGLALAVALGFAPTVFLLLLGQISGFLLLGLAGFLWAVRNQRFALAGCLAALTAIKPHLFVPFALLLGLEAIHKGAFRRTVASGAIALGLFAVIPLAWNPHVWSQYLAATGAGEASSHNTIREWVHPTLGYAIRQALPGEPFRAMFLPLAFVLPLVAVYWYVRRAEWNWMVELPRVVLASMLAAPYGAWGFDLVVLLVPVVQVAVWLIPHRALAIRFAIAFGALNVLALLTLLRENSMTNVWLCPAVALGYLAVGFSLSPRASRIAAAVPA
jgi:hypothetical protein